MAALFLAPLYILINAYVVRWMIRWMGACHRLFQTMAFRASFIGVYIILATALLTGFLIKKPANLHRILKHTGNYFLGTFIYILLVIAVVDFGRLILKYIFHAPFIGHRSTFVITGLICTILIISLSVYGILHVTHVKTTPYEINVEKTVDGMDSLKIVLLADTHFGYSMGTAQAKRIVKKINTENPDVVRIAGDIFDNEYDAISKPDKLKEILKEFKKQILSQTQILNKICFMIRVAAKRLDKSLKKLEKSMRITEQSAFIQLKPEGNCWKEYICFLYENKEALPSEFYPHCNSLLSEWVEVISLKNDILPGAREAGLLAIYIIKKMLMDKFPDKEATKRLLKVSMCCYGSIRKEFNDFIESIVFDEECREKYGNIENLMMYLLTDFSCGYIAKYDSQLLVRIAKREWLISEQSKKRKFPYSPYGSEEKIYGFNYDGEYGYNQPSGLREPFHALFNWNTNVAIDFVLELCNNAVQTYINQKLVDKNEKEKSHNLDNCGLAVYDYCNVFCKRKISWWFCDRCSASG